MQLNLPLAEKSWKLITAKVTLIIDNINSNLFLDHSLVTNNINLSDKITSKFF